MSHPAVILEDMKEQLVLVEPEEHPWHLDERTREVGRRGIAQARRALRDARAARPAAA